MQVTFLGTSAATSIPLPFCRCRVCATARERGGPDLRKRASLLVNTDLLIDFGPDLMAASFMHGIDTAAIRYLLQTHPHADHFDASAFATRFAGYAVKDVPHLDLCASARTIDRMNEMLRDDGYIRDLNNPSEQEALNLTAHAIAPFETVPFGPYAVTALPANHDDSVGALLYLIEEDGVALFYGTDTDTLPDGIWRHLRERRLSLDLVILDQTYGPEADGDGHLSARRLIATRERMAEEGLLGDGSRVFATHLSHEGSFNHAELSDFATRHGYEIPCDGMVVDVPKPS